MQNKHKQKIKSSKGFTLLEILPRNSRNRNIGGYSLNCNKPK